MCPRACDRQAANDSKSPGTTTCASLYSFTMLHISSFLILAQQLPRQFIQAAMLRLEGPGKTTRPTPRLSPDPSQPLCQGEKGIFPPSFPRKSRALRAECDGKRGCAERELAAHQREWEGELERASSPSGARAVSSCATRARLGCL